MSSLTQFTGSLPVGSVIDWPIGAQPPTNWVRCGGKPLLRSSYPALSEIYPSGLTDFSSGAFSLVNQLTPSLLPSGPSHGVSIDTNTNIMVLAKNTSVVKTTGWFAESLKLTVTGGTGITIVGLEKMSTGRLWVFAKDNSRVVYSWYSDNNGDTWTAAASFSAASALAGVNRVVKAKGSDDFFILGQQTGAVSIKTYHSTNPISGWSLVDFGTGAYYDASSTVYLLDVAKIGSYWLFASYYNPATGFGSPKQNLWYTSNLTAFGLIRSEGVLQDTSESTASYTPKYGYGFAQNSQGVTIFPLGGVIMVSWKNDHPYSTSAPSTIQSIYYPTAPTLFDYGTAENWGGVKNFKITSVFCIDDVFIATGGDIAAGAMFEPPMGYIFISMDGINWKLLCSGATGASSYLSGYYAGVSGGYSASQSNYLLALTEALSTTLAMPNLIPYANGYVLTGGQSQAYMGYSASIAYHSSTYIRLPADNNKIMKVK